MRVLIIDNEDQGRKKLAAMVKQEFPASELIMEASSAFEAKLKIDEHHPDIVILDVQIPKLSGFDLIKFFPKRKFQFIIVTDCEHHKLQALECGAIDYLMKPVMPEDLRESMLNTIKYINEKQMLDQIKPCERLRVRNNNKSYYIPFDKIMYIVGQINYSVIHTADDKPIMVAKTLKTFESMLPIDTFIRIHKSSIINRNYISFYDHEEKKVTLKNNCELAVTKPPAHL